MSRILNDKASQLLPLELLKKTFKSNSDKILLQELNAIVMKYYPNYSKENITNLYHQLSKSGCTYATMANLIIDEFEGDTNSFRAYFGDSFFNHDGTINYNKLMVDIFACISQMVELKITRYRRFESDNYAEAALKLLGNNYDEENDNILALMTAGWMADGFSSNGKLLFVNETLFESKTIIGNYSDIALELFNIEDSSMTKERLEALLKEQKLRFSFSDTKVQSKLSGLEKKGIENIKKWMKIYFEKNNINLKVDAFFLNVSDLSYEEFMVTMLSIYDAGYFVEVSPNVSQNIFMTDGSKLGWTSVHNHAMNFIGFDTNKDIVVCSWGQQYIIPKEYYNKLGYRPIKVIDNKKNFHYNNISNR